MRFAIIAMPHMGADRIVRVFRAHPEILCRANIFHPGRLDDFLRRAEPDRVASGDLSGSADPDALLEVAFKAQARRKAIGFTIHDGENNAILQKVLDDASIAKIVAYRKNTLAAYAATFAGNKVSPQRAQGRAMRRFARFDPDAFSLFREACFAFYRYIVEQLSIRDGRFQIAHYEESSDPLLMSVLAKFVGADPLLDRETRACLKGISMRPAAEVPALFSNPQDVRTFLSQARLPHWALEGVTPFERDGFEAFSAGELNALNVDQVRTDDAADIAEKAGKYDLPYLAAFLADIVARQSGEREAYGRRYQRDIIHERQFKTISPLTGEAHIAARSTFVHGRVFYRFPDPFGYYVSSARIKLGYPLAALYVPRANCLLKWDSLAGAVEPHHIKLLTSLIARQPDQETSDPAVQIVMGHDNFAHHLWNELPALEQLVTKDCNAPFPRLIVRRETLGAIDRIFPELQGWDIRRPSGDTWYFGNDPDGLYVNLGSHRISSSLRARIVTHAQAQTSAATRALIGEVNALGGPVFWISVRTVNPTMTNQRDVLVAIAEGILQQYAKCCILFDGFSTPRDMSRAGPVSLRYYAATVEAARDEADATIETVLSHAGPTAAQAIRNVAGLDVLDSMALAQLADVYFCHLGTTQHKIGWTANKPGIIHANRTLLATRPEIWHGEALEAGREPLAIPEDMVEDVAPGQRDGNYRALDADALARWVLQRFEIFLMQPGATIA